jgi:hypothetical protein
MAEPRIRVYEVSSPEHGTCWLTSLTAALHHVKECVKQDGSDKVALRVRSGAVPDYEGVAARFKAFHQGSTWGWRRCLWVCREFLAAEGSLDWNRAQYGGPE